MSWIKTQGEELQRLQNRFEMPPSSTIPEASTLQTRPQSDKNVSTGNILVRFAGFGISPWIPLVMDGPGCSWTG
jgi:hypothetical protein